MVIFILDIFKKAQGAESGYRLEGALIVRLRTAIPSSRHTIGGAAVYGRPAKYFDRGVVRFGRATPYAGLTGRLANAADVASTVNLLFCRRMRARA
jgi:hypothetical protein